MCLQNYLSIIIFRTAQSLSYFWAGVSAGWFNMEIGNQVALSWLLVTSPWTDLVEKKYECVNYTEQCDWVGSADAIAVTKLTFFCLWLSSNGNLHAQNVAERLVSRNKVAVKGRKLNLTFRKRVYQRSVRQTEDAVLKLWERWGVIVHSVNHAQVHQWMGKQLCGMSGQQQPGTKMTSILWELLKVVALLQRVCSLSTGQWRFSTSRPSGFQVHQE